MLGETGKKTNKQEHSSIGITHQEKPCILGVRVCPGKKGAVASSCSSICFWLFTFLTHPTRTLGITGWKGPVSFSALIIQAFLVKMASFFLAKSKSIRCD